ncbi:MAG TPA: 2-oxo-4-hydroxy-4-carboxy-5-ureidoimidazoline decarboxylase [Enhygromyxa sp.]|nr:2-oxo-4-hydroxy-4-carboxy-5-ureidoimidazoline decarboxylase [Enhygromyxa sp.]
MKSASKLDAMSEAQAGQALARCCGASRWVAGMLERRPFGSDTHLRTCADETWAQMGPDDYREAFSHHPRIGASLDALREKFATTADLSAGEQAGALAASEAELEVLRDGNLRYEHRFGHIFIVCATGKTAAQMLELLEARLDNDPDTELRIAAAQQHQITLLRLDNLGHQDFR